MGVAMAAAALASAASGVGRAWWALGPRALGTPRGPKRRSIDRSMHALLALAGAATVVEDGRQCIARSERLLSQFVVGLTE